MPLIKGFGFIYLAVWILLVLHWLRRKQFYPVFGTGLRTKIGWGVTFLFFNPLLSLLYIVFGVFHRPTETPARKKLTRSRIIVFGLSAVTILLFELPADLRKDRIAIITEESDRPGNSLSMKATACEAQNNTSASSSTSKPSISWLDVRRVAILNESAHPLMQKVGHRVQQAMLDLPMVEEVAYYPKGALPEEREQLADFFLILRMPTFKKSFRPGGRAVEADIVCTAGAADLESEYHAISTPIIGLSMNISVAHKSKTTGVESSSAVYDDEAASISTAISEQLVKTITKTASEGLRAAPLPATFYGPYEPAPALPLEESTTAIRKLSGYGLMKHNQTTWLLTDPRPASTVLTNLQAALVQEGWKGKGRGDPIRLTRGHEHLVISKRKQRGRGWMVPEQNASEKPQPIVVCYENPYTPEETEAAATDLLDHDDPDIGLLLAFKHSFENSKSETTRHRYQSLLEQAQPNSASTCLEMAKYWKTKNDTARAFELLDQTKAMARMESAHNDKYNEIKKLAKELGDEDRAKECPSEKSLRAIGFIPAENLTTNLALTIELDEPFGFYERLNNDIRTYAFRVIENSSDAPAGNIPAPDHRRHWRLMRAEKEESTTTTHSETGTLENDVWGAATSFHLRSELSPRIGIKATQTGDRRFEISIAPNR